MKNKFDFTEGEWNYVGYGDEFQIQGEYHSIGLLYHQPCNEHEANARLISKAPEMLNALIEGVDLLRSRKIRNKYINLIEKATSKSWSEIND